MKSVTTIFKRKTLPANASEINRMAVRMIENIAHRGAV